MLLRDKSVCCDCAEGLSEISRSWLRWSRSNANLTLAEEVIPHQAQPRTYFPTRAPN
jgi:hypothetical protein